MSSKPETSSNTQTKTSNKPLNEQLIKACEKQDIRLVKELISKGAKSDFVQREEGTWGAYKQYSTLHSAILGLGRKPTDKEKETWKEVILVLLKNGANPNVTKDSYDWRGCGSRQSAYELLGYQTRSSDPDLLAAFLGAGLDPNLARATDIHSMRTDGCTKTHLLHDFASSGSIDCVIELLNAGADIDIRATESIQNERGYCEEKSETPLHVAVLNDELEMCILLLAKGAQINAIEFHLDAEQMEDVVKKNTTDDPRDEAYLNPWKITPNECTSLHLAINEKNLDLANFLLICGADSNIPYKRGDTESITSLEWFKSQDKDSQTLLTKSKSQMLVMALSDKLDIRTSLESMSRDTQDKILKTFDKIQEIGWNLNTNHFHDIFTILQSF